MKINPCIDLAFKWLFGRERNLALLKDLLNAVLSPADCPAIAQITDIELLNPFSEPDSPDDKLSIVDVKARDNFGRQFDLEMQLLRDRSFSKRVLYYWAGLHLQQLGQGNSYSGLRPTISVCIANFTLFEGDSRYYQIFELRNREGDRRFTSDIMVITMEMPKFILEPSEITTPLESWLYFLQNAEQLDPGKLHGNLNRPQIKEALEELEMLSQDDMERERYLARMRVLMDEKSRLHSAREEGLEQGLEKGILLGEQLSLFRLLEKRFGSVDNRLVERIRTLDLQLLEELFNDTLGFNSVDDVEEWLAKREPHKH